MVTIQALSANMRSSNFATRFPYYPSPVPISVRRSQQDVYSAGPRIRPIIRYLPVCFIAAIATAYQVKWGMRPTRLGEGECSRLYSQDLDTNKIVHHHGQSTLEATNDNCPLELADPAAVESAHQPGNAVSTVESVKTPARRLSPWSGWSGRRRWWTFGASIVMLVVLLTVSLSPVSNTQANPGSREELRLAG
ncbi:hypothetical protein B0T22DRAFT_436494 [Podospora appendiculata]|uniref:Uncharacterized protein n=1 Tax=Podospora appendiculata TaxID=314037 RepID=A0AAE1CG34_9PEZI|nr:hypothetical protein B0T22DRAFT_436494 [Podospora appendiculata]